MIEFCGLEELTIDGSGRVKLSSSVLRDFLRHGEGDVVLHCVMPERCVAIYPREHWQLARQRQEEALGQLADSIVYRRKLRRFGALSQGGQISNQGRITVPPQFREFAHLDPGTTIHVVGCEVGVELWNSERWANEFEVLESHIVEKAGNEMSADLHKEVHL